jgi:NAD(P)-dependent dehydrogenase (short-subunit alcohol dehydrogenase family)
MTVVSGTPVGVAAGSLTGRVAVVTGGGRGLGRVFAQTLAAAGAAVAVTARSADQVAEAVASIEAAGGRAVGATCDVTDQPEVERALVSVQRQLGPVDLLVNNAGEWGPIDPVWEVDPEQWWRTMEIHVRGSFLCARAVLPGMIERRRGRIVNVVSQAGIHRWPTCSAYAVSKAAVVKFTENLAVEARRHGVSVFACDPGIATTGLTDQAMTMDAPAESSAGRAAAWIRRQVADGRAVPPELGARLVAMLADGRADALTGRCLTVHDDVAALVARAEEIQRDDLYTLKLSRLGEPAAPPPAAPARARSPRTWLGAWWPKRR